uniref:PNPLA domain-containing protein n=1 Tax=viral metagenome TaxID=1070528 RepID=A0A6C0BPQ9_9ZZZZ
MRYLILSLDGGGARLLLQWTLLKRILGQYPDFLKEVTVFAGTSAGAILASALASGLENEADEIITYENMRKVFERRATYKISSLGGLVKSKYPNRNLRRLLETHLKDATLDQVPRALFIPAFAVNSNHLPPVHGAGKKESYPPGDAVSEEEKQESEQKKLAAQFEHIGAAGASASLQRRCERWHPVFYHNLIDTDDRGVKVVEAVMKSTAAPTYFPLDGNCVDGGVVHNNPSLAMLTHLLALGAAPEEIYILSLGTGEMPRELHVCDDASLGLLKWVTCILDMIMDGNQEAISQSVHQILGNRFHRVEPLLSKDIALDDVSEHAEMMRVANEYDLTETFEWIEWINQ